MGEAFVRIRPDTTGFGSELDRKITPAAKRAEQQLRRTNSEMTRFGRGTLVGTGALGGLGRAAAFASVSFIGGAGLTYALRSTVQAAEDAQAVQAQLKNALDTLGISFERNKQAINDRTTALSQMSGFDDELLNQTFVNFVRRTNDVTESLRLNAIAVNVARGRNISLESAASLVTRASLGMAGALRRVGIAAEKGATATQLLDLLQRKYAGSAEAYGNTAAGAQERFAVAVQNTQEVIGAALLPSLTKALNKATEWLNNSENQKRIQDDVNKTVSVGGRTLIKLGDAAHGARVALGPLWDVEEQGRTRVVKLNEALGGQNQHLRDLGVNAGKAAAGLKTYGQAFTTVFEALLGINPDLTFFDQAKASTVPSKVKGQGFAGRPLTPQEQIALALSGDPNNIGLLRQDRAMKQRVLDFALRQIAQEKGNTAAFAAKATTLRGEIVGITDKLSSIAEGNAQKAADARKKAADARAKMIEALIPGAVRGSGRAGDAFSRLQAAFAAAIPSAVSGVGRVSDLSELTNQSRAQQIAAVRTQIEEQRVTNEKKLIPFLEIEVRLARQHAALLKKAGASELDKLNATLEIARLRARIRDINKADKASAGFTLAEFTAQITADQAMFGSNVGAGPLSAQDARGAVKGAVTVVQHFNGDRPNPAQAIQQASQAARALR